MYMCWARNHPDLYLLRHLIPLLKTRLRSDNGLLAGMSQRRERQGGGADGKILWELGRLDYNQHADNWVSFAFPVECVSGKTDNEVEPVSHNRDADKFCAACQQTTPGGVVSALSQNGYGARKPKET